MGIYFFGRFYLVNWLPPFWIFWCNRWRRFHYWNQKRYFLKKKNSKIEKKIKIFVQNRNFWWKNEIRRTFTSYFYVVLLRRTFTSFFYVVLLRRTFTSHFYVVLLRRTFTTKFLDEIFFQFFSPKFFCRYRLYQLRLNWSKNKFQLESVRKKR